MAIPGDGFVRVAVEFLLHTGDQAINIFDFAYDIDVGGDIDDLFDMIEAYILRVYGEVTAWLSNDVSIASFSAWDINPLDSDMTSLGQRAITYAGTATDDNLASGVAKLMHIYTEDADVRGRKYIPGLTEQANSAGGNFAGGTLVADFVNWLAEAAIGEAIGSHALAPGVWSLTKVAFAQFSGEGDSPGFPAYQRRRRQGVGV